MTCNCTSRSRIGTHGAQLCETNNLSEKWHEIYTDIFPWLCIDIPHLYSKHYMYKLYVHFMYLFLCWLLATRMTHSWRRSPVYINWWSRSAVYVFVTGMDRKRTFTSLKCAFTAKLDIRQCTAFCYQLRISNQFFLSKIAYLGFQYWRKLSRLIFLNIAVVTLKKDVESNLRVYVHKGAC